MQTIIKMTRKHVALYIISRPMRWFSGAKLFCALLSRQSTVTLPSDGVRLSCGLRGGTGLWCALTGLDYEQELAQFIKLIKPGDVIFDIGANIGTYTIRAAHRTGPSGQVFSFEPISLTFNRLKHAISINGAINVRAYCNAIGKESGTATIHDGGRESSAGLLTNTGNAYQVEIVTLDEFTESLQLDRVDWVKMDIEGAEPLVVRGALKVIEKFKPAFLFENHDGGPETQRLLGNVGYRIGHFGESMRLVPSTNGTNLFAIHPDNPRSARLLGSGV